MLIGGVLGGRGGVEIAFVIAIAMNFFSYWFSDKVVLQGLQRTTTLKRLFGRAGALRDCKRARAIGGNPDAAALSY